MSKTKTIFIENALLEKDATDLYNVLRTEIMWENGIKSRNGFTRKGKTITPEHPLFFNLMFCVKNTLMFFPEEYTVLGIYLNFYENGEMYTPNHSHKGTQQLIISLGSTRTLIIGKKEYKMTNGSAIVFGSSIHGVPKELEVQEGRISIATFMIKK